MNWFSDFVIHKYQRGEQQLIQTTQADSRCGEVYEHLPRIYIWLTLSKGKSLGVGSYLISQQTECLQGQSAHFSVYIIKPNSKSQLLFYFHLFDWSQLRMNGADLSGTSFQQQVLRGRTFKEQPRRTSYPANIQIFLRFLKKVKIHEHSSLPYSDFVLWFLVYTYPSVVH